VDGFIEAKSLKTNTGGGGSGGSILIRTQTFTGGHTSALRVTGGTSQAGGGGAGGRIAVYYTNNLTEPFYGGVFETYGGDSPSGGEAGASGTTYLEHVTNGYTTLRVDNNKHEPIRKVIRNEGRRVSISGGSNSRQVYTVPDGVTVSSSTAYYTGPYPHYYPYNIGRMFDGNINTRFITTATRPRLSIDLKGVVFVNHVRIYPACSSGPAKFKVSKFLIIIFSTHPDLLLIKSFVT
jgi:hypothetical protein